jgi:ABC-type nitrate/sulfonate/bicarbonate transport system ATPase subunit
VTHAIEEAALMGTRVLVLRDIPNTQATVFDNPGAADPEFRNHQDYADMVHQLRLALDRAA